MKNNAAVSRVKVSADGHGVLSHAGVGILREIADLTELSAQVTAASADTYRGHWDHAPGAVFADLAAAVADGADCVDGAAQSRSGRGHVFGPSASTTITLAPLPRCSVIVSKTRRLPSGDQSASPTLTPHGVTWCAPVPSVPTTQSEETSPG